MDPIEPAYSRFCQNLFLAGSNWQLAPVLQPLSGMTGVCGERCFDLSQLQFWIHSKAGFWANHRVADLH